MTPAQFRREWTFSGIFPPIDLREYTGGNTMSGKRFDISELYDYLKSKANTYVISFDIVNLLPINENIGRDAGDKVILEALHRIDNAADDDMLVSVSAEMNLFLLRDLTTRRLSAELRKRFFPLTADLLNTTVSLYPFQSVRAQ